MTKIAIIKYFFLTVFIFVFLFTLPNYTYAKNGEGSSKLTTCQADVAHDGILDQSQCRYDGGLSARTSPANSVWQSFTAGKTGALTEIDFGFFGNINGYGTLSVYVGEGISGEGLASLRKEVVCNGGDCMIPFFFNVPVVAGQVYTFRFIPGYNIPDPYGIQIGAHNSYKYGSLGYDVFGTSNLLKSYDAVFSTFVK